MNPARAIVIVALAALVGGGCGGNSSSSAAPTGASGSTGQQGASVSLQARDASAKVIGRTAETVMEVYATDNQGNYTGATVAALQKIEPTLNGGSFTVTVTNAGKGYTIVSTSTTGNTFTVARDARGTVAFSCNPPGSGGCPTPGNTW